MTGNSFPLANPMKLSLPLLLLTLALPAIAQESAAPSISSASETPVPASTPTTPPPPEKSAGSAPKKSAEQALALQITKASQDREQRMMAMHEAMLKLRQAGEISEADRLERRLQAMLAPRDPQEDDAIIANKMELMDLKKSVNQLSEELLKLRSVLEQNSRIIDEILAKAVPDISPAVLEELKQQATKKPEVRKAP
jgi:hypothetical protein